MTRVNCLIAALSLHTIWLLLLTKPCSSLEPKTSPSFPAILIFGDSTVDTGNNNFIPTIFKGNYSPYGKNFPGHLATGRFSDGKLIPDMVASRLGIKELVPPFLDPKLSNDDIKTGVSFASAGTGFDDLTAAISKVIPHFVHQTGFEHTNKGCCGTGLVEAGPLCNPKIPTCENSSKFMFWDSIHPTEAAYKFIAESLLKKLGDPQNWN